MNWTELVQQPSATKSSLTLSPLSIICGVCVRVVCVCVWCVCACDVWHICLCTDRFKKFRLFLSSLSTATKLPSDVEARILNVCSYFQLSMKCLPNSRMDVLTSISYHGDVIPKLWFFLSTLTKLTPEGVSQAVGEPRSAQTLDTFRLFCQVACHLIA